MKKNYLISRRARGKLLKLVVLMKITFFLMLIFCLSVSANSFSQTFNFKFKNIELKKIFEEIKSQSNYSFVYNLKDLKDSEKISIDVKDKTIDEVLTIALDNSGLSYTIVDGVVIIKPATLNQTKIEQIEIKGKVTDEKGSVMPGVTIVVQGTINGVVTDSKGRYTIKAKKTDALRFSFIGYKTQIELIGDKTEINVRMKPTSENLEEVAVVAFGEQKKESVVSAITTVRADDLKTSSSDLTSTFAGKIAGLIGWQTGGLPGALTEEEMNTKFYIRGITSFQSKANIDPLILLDGVESSKLDLSRMAPEDIETFSVLKDASATAMYGARGANGIIVVTTKKGQEGSVYATARYEAVFSMPTKEIEVVDPINWMKMYNRALLTRNPEATPKYSVEQIERTASASIRIGCIPQMIGMT